MLRNIIKTIALAVPAIFMAACCNIPQDADTAAVSALAERVVGKSARKVYLTQISAQYGKDFFFHI